VSGADLARNLFDVLTAIPPTPPAPAGAGGAAAAAQPRLPGQAADDGEAPPLASWCGAAEAGTAAAAADAGEGARRRRKRRRQEEGADAEPSAAPAGAQAARAARGMRWASAALQRRAWSGAWLAVLRAPLPEDIFRKARRPSAGPPVLGRLPTVRRLRLARGSLHAWCVCARACRSGSREQPRSNFGFGACGLTRKRVCSSRRVCTSGRSVCGRAAR